MKIISIIGTRPQIIKAAYMDKICKQNDIDHLIIDTNQHYSNSLNGIFSDEYKIKMETPYYLMNSINIFEPNFIFVYGDTNSTVSGIKLSQNIAPLVHIEAGCRCGNKSMPEEYNRIYADLTCQILMCPTEVSMMNVLDLNSYFSGDIMYDIFLEEIKELNEYPLEKDSYYLTTIHRQYNSDNDSFYNICKLLNSLDKPVIFPVHPKFSMIPEFNNILWFTPQNHRNMLRLLKNAYKVVTDSGGLHREAYFMNKQSYIIRTESEFPEMFYNNCSFLINKNKIEESKSIIINRTLPKFTNELFGDGKAGQKIINILKENYHNEDTMVI